MAGSLGGHCGTLAPVAAMTSLHFLVSAVITASISSDELPTTSKPCSLRRSLNLPSATAVLTSLASRSTTGCGVLAGASSPNHPLSSYPGTPASCMVGTCGIRLKREGDATANILPLPPAASAMAEGGPVNMTPTTPAAMSVMAGAVPRVGDLGDVGLGHHLQQFHAEMRLRAEPDRGVVELAGVCTRKCQQLLHAGGFDLRAGDEHEIDLGDDADRYEIAERIVGEVGIKIWIDHQIGVDGHEQRVAVGRGAGDLSGRQPAIGAGLVLDDHRLAHRVAQAIPQRACDQVDRAARRLGEDKADGLGRIGLVG